MHSKVNHNITGAGGEGICYRGGCDQAAGGFGGGIYNDQGVVILDDVQVMGNETGKGGPGAEGGFGGGIYNKNMLTINSCVIEANRTGKGGEEQDSYDLQAKSGGLGGGIYNEGELQLIYSQVNGNQTGDGGFATQDCAPGGEGGGIFNQGSIQTTYSSINGNITGNIGECDPLGDYQGLGASGGGIHNSGELSLAYSEVISNTTGDGLPQMISGSGGGIFSDGELFLDGVSLKQNQVGQNGSGGLGGGAYITGDATVVIQNALIADNHLSLEGLGSGIFADSVSLNLLHTTLARNTGGDRSGLYMLDATACLTNTILVSHTVGITASVGSLVSLDHTLWGSGSWANLANTGGMGTITTTHNLTDTPGFMNPELGDYHLDAGSDARDSGLLGVSVTDLDNQPRPNPDTNLPDLGADEYWLPTPIMTLTITAPISGTTYTDILFTSEVNPITATPNFYFVWVPTSASGQGTNTVTYSWQNAGQKTVKVTAINSLRSAQTSRVIDIIASEFKVYMPLILYFPE